MKSKEIKKYLEKCITERNLIEKSIITYLEARINSCKSGPKVKISDFEIEEMVKDLEHFNNKIKRGVIGLNKSYLEKFGIELD